MGIVAFIELIIILVLIALLLLMANDLDLDKSKPYGWTDGKWFVFGEDPPTDSSDSKLEWFSLYRQLKAHQVWATRIKGLVPLFTHEFRRKE